MTTLRLIDYWLGEHHNLREDRQAGDLIEQRWPGTARKVREARAFLTRAVTYAGRQGIGQYLVAGHGFPARPGVHETARMIVPDARVAYADADRVVVEHFRVPAEGDPGIAAVQAAPRIPEAVAAHPCVRAVIGWDEPACVVWPLGATFMTGAAAAGVITGYAGLLAPGSYLVVSAAVPAGEEAAGLAALYEQLTGDRVYGHTAGDIAGWLDGLDLVVPGVADVRGWRAGMPDPGLAPRPAFQVVGAVARVP